MQKPLIIEGPPGCRPRPNSPLPLPAGDTVIERLQCYAGITEEKAIGKFDPALQDCSSVPGRAHRTDWESIRDKPPFLHFFVQGPLLRALLSERRACCD